jgi:putative ABC transport system ATP-binding protein
MLEIKNLYKVFNKNTVNENVVFNNLNLKLEKSDFITIIGSNGAGKSTLLNIVAGSIEEDSGSIKLDGDELSGIPEYKRASNIGRVFQDPTKGTAPDMTILENLSMSYNKGKAFGLAPGISKKNIAHFKELLSTLNLGLEDKLYTKIGLLSGGQRQALSLISAVMSKPELLLLDEHTAALDPAMAKKVLLLTREIIYKQHFCTLMVTHNMKAALEYGTRTIMMHEGQIIMDLTGKERENMTVELLIKQFENRSGTELDNDRLF